MQVMGKGMDRVEFSAVYKKLRPTDKLPPFCLDVKATANPGAICTSTTLVEGIPNEPTITEKCLLSSTGD